MTNALIDLMVDASVAAAKVINAVYDKGFVAQEKSDGSPVTEADQAAERVILDYLATTGIPVLAEESAAAGLIPVLGDRFFVVDPLDGTKEFVKRNGEFTVNIALVEHGRPVLGVVLTPVTGDTFIGTPEGAFEFSTLDGVRGKRQRIAVDAGLRPLRVVASRSHGHAALATLCETMGVGDDVSVGSSLKFCLLARGQAQLYPRFTPTCEWDTAAGQAVLEAAGGAVVTLDGKPLAYGKAAPRYLNPFFVAAASLELAQRAAAEMRGLGVDAISG